MNDQLKVNDVMLDVHRLTTSAEPFDLTRFLLGHTTAWGMFQDRFGRVKRRFTVQIDGRWDGPDFVLREEFSYCDGETEARTWRLKPGTDGTFTATCPDVVGVARGMAEAGGTRMTYAFRLKMKNRELVVDFDDRVFPMDGTTAMNRAIVRKWGIKLGEVTLFFKRDGEAAAQHNVAGRAVGQAEMRPIRRAVSG